MLRCDVVDDAALYPSGWDEDIAKVGTTNYFASGRVLFSGPKFTDDDRPIPASYSLSKLIQWLYDQGQVGSCFSNMGASVLQIMMAALVSSGQQGTVFNPSRRLIWYGCRKLDGSFGRRDDGGSIVNTFAALGDGQGGIGDCSEDMWPYKASHSWLEQVPPDSIIQAASKTHINSISEAPLDADTWKRSILNGCPIGIGIWWPYGWDTKCDKFGRTTGIGVGSFGHAVTVIGWIDNWDGHNYYEILNSHGKIYGGPPTDLTNSIVGYQYTGFSFFAREDHLEMVMSKNYTENYHAAGVEGFSKKEISYMLLS